MSIELDVGEILEDKEMNGDERDDMAELSARGLPRGSGPGKERYLHYAS